MKHARQTSNHHQSEDSSAASSRPLLAPFLEALTDQDLNQQRMGTRLRDQRNAFTSSLSHASGNLVRWSAIAPEFATIQTLAFVRRQRCIDDAIANIVGENGTLVS